VHSHTLPETYTYILAGLYNWIFIFLYVDFILPFQMAMDYLPIQASSVPCKRVFSSSSKTMMKRRSHLKPNIMEGLQMLKFMLKKDQLNFTKGWKTLVADMMVDLDNGGDMLQDILNTVPTEIDKVLEHLMDHEDSITDE
jgi:hAT family C-terminal dimerisation region